MRTITRLKATLTASFDNFVSNVENQEAVIDHMISEIKRALGDVNICIHRTQKTIDNTKKQEQDIKQRIVNWQEYAKELYQQSPQKSRDCVARVIQLKEHLKILEQNIIQFHHDLEALKTDKRNIESKLTDIQMRKTKLKSRQARANSLGISHEASRINDLDSFFDRWEDKLIIQETKNDYSHAQSDADELEMELENLKLEDQIEKELKELIQD